MSKKESHKHGDDLSEPLLGSPEDKNGHFAFTVE